MKDGLPGEGRRSDSYSFAYFYIPIFAYYHAGILEKILRPYRAFESLRTAGSTHSPFLRDCVVH